MTDHSSGWDIRTLGDVATVIRGVTFRRGQALDSAADGYLPVVRATNILDGRLNLDDGLVYVPQELVRSEQRLKLGDVVLSTSSGSVSAIGRSAIVDRDWEGAFGAFCGVLRPSSAVEPRYLAHYVTTRDVRERWSSLAAGTNINNLKRHDLERTPIPLPPLPEQRRIVAAIEEQFSRLDAAKRGMGSARSRIALLHRVALGSIAPAEASRRRLGEVAEIRLGRQRSPKNHAGPHMRPYLRAANVTWEGLDLIDVKEMNFSPDEQGGFRLLPGDLLVAEASGSRNEVGKPAVWQGDLEECYFQNTLLRVRSEVLNAEFLRYVILDAARSGRIAQIARGVGIHHLGKRGLEGLEVPVPTAEEQARAVARVEHLLSVIGSLEGGLRRAEQRANSLKAAILREAFIGRLAAPSWEIAS